MKTKDKNKTALVIKSEMTPIGPPQLPSRPYGRRDAARVYLREYEDGNSSPAEMVADFLQNVYQATRSDISGATGQAWATIQAVVDDFERSGHIRVNRDVTPWEYTWKR